jgi:hypothetical protein
MPRVTERGGRVTSATKPSPTDSAMALILLFMFGYLRYFGIIFNSLLISACDIIQHKVFTLEKPVNL